MMSEQTFPIKAGTCTITDTAIVLVRSGWRGALAQMLFGNDIKRVRFLYGGIGGFSLLVGIAALVLQGEAFELAAVVPPIFIGLIFLRTALRSNDISVATNVPREAIEAIEVHPPRPGRSRGLFVVHFKEAGEAKRRLIILRRGTESFEDARAVMRDQGLIDAPAPDG
jgi:hypothetical protein